MSDKKDPKSSIPHTPPKPIHSGLTPIDCAHFKKIPIIGTIDCTK